MLAVCSCVTLCLLQIYQWQVWVICSKDRASYSPKRFGILCCKWLWAASPRLFVLIQFAIFSQDQNQARCLVINPGWLVHQPLDLHWNHFSLSILAYRHSLQIHRQGFFCSYWPLISIQTLWQHRFDQLASPKRHCIWTIARLQHPWCMHSSVHLLLFHYAPTLLSVRKWYLCLWTLRFELLFLHSQFVSILLSKCQNPQSIPLSLSPPLFSAPGLFSLFTMLKSSPCPFLGRLLLMSNETMIHQPRNPLPNLLLHPCFLLHLRKSLSSVFLYQMCLSVLSWF